MQQGEASASANFETAKTVCPPIPRRLQPNKRKRKNTSKGQDAGSTSTKPFQQTNQKVPGAPKYKKAKTLDVESENGLQSLGSSVGSVPKPIQQDMQHKEASVSANFETVKTICPPILRQPQPNERKRRNTSKGQDAGSTSTKPNQQTKRKVAGTPKYKSPKHWMRNPKMDCNRSAQV